MLHIDINVIKWFEVSFLAQRTAPTLNTHHHHSVVVTTIFATVINTIRMMVPLPNPNKQPPLSPS
jgi:hypothetical protein